ncbi:MAG TPA: hypothetical protein PKL17_10655 [Pseudomonadota bacterium]|nr:hypothetical protein [Pseudomonadota bacterium]
MRLTSLVTTLSLTATLCPLPALAQLPPPPSVSTQPSPQPYPQPAYPQQTPNAYPQQYAPQQYAPQQYAPQQNPSAYPQQYAPQPYPQPQYPSYPQQPIVELRSNDPAATLFMVTGGGTRMVWGRHHRYLSHYDVWSPVCRTPCGVPIDPSGLYQIRGLRMNASSSFVIPQTQLVTLDVDAGHSGPRAGGIVLTTFGGIVTVLGITFAGIGIGQANANYDARVGQSSSSGFLVAGGTMLGIGTAMLAGGITMIVLSRTTVRISGGSRLAQTQSLPRIALAPDGIHF